MQAAARRTAQYRRAKILMGPQTTRPAPAQPSNPVLSLSKHAWSPRPALRQAQGEVAIALVLDGHHESGLRPAVDRAGAETSGLPSEQVGDGGVVLLHG